MYSTHTKFGVAGEPIGHGHIRFISPTVRRNVYYIRAHGMILKGNHLVSEKIHEIPTGVSVTFMNQIGTCGRHRPSLSYLHMVGPRGPSAFRDLEYSSRNNVIKALKKSTGLKQDTYEHGDQMIDIRLNFQNIPLAGVYLLKYGREPTIIFHPKHIKYMMLSELVEYLGRGDYITAACRNVPIERLPLSSKVTRMLLKSALPRKQIRMSHIRKSLLRDSKRVPVTNKLSLRMLRSKKMYSPISPNAR
jgi:hypothetical protein